MNRTIVRSIGAILAGFISVAVLSVALDSVFEMLGIFPGTMHPELYAPWMLMVALVYRSLATIFGGYITAKIAPTDPMRHIYILAALGFVGGVAGAINGWSYGNHWYPVALAITGPFFVWFGGILQVRIWKK